MRGKVLHKFRLATCNTVNKYTVTLYLEMILRKRLGNFVRACTGSDLSPCRANIEGRNFSQLRHATSASAILKFRESDLCNCSKITCDSILAIEIALIITFFAMVLWLLRKPSFLRLLRFDVVPPFQSAILASTSRTSDSDTGHKLIAIWVAYWRCRDGKKCTFF